MAGREHGIMQIRSRGFDIICLYSGRTTIEGDKEKMEINNIRDVYYINVVQESGKVLIYNSTRYKLLNKRYLSLTSVGYILILKHHTSNYLVWNCAMINCE